MNEPFSRIDQVRSLVQAMSIKEMVGSVVPPGYPDRFGHYQYTGHGRIFFSCDPRVDEIHIDDIALHLSRICRFGGATKRFLSVAEHCILCSQIVPEEFALEALLHDAAEAYIGDLIRPLKYLPMFGDIYLKVEAGIEKSVAERFKLQYPWPAWVKSADEAVLGAEIAQNIVSKRANILTDDVQALRSNQNLKLMFMDPPWAETMFLDRFEELAGKRGVL